MAVTALQGLWASFTKWQPRLSRKGRATSESPPAPDTWVTRRGFQPPAGASGETRRRPSAEDAAGLQRLRDVGTESPGAVRCRPSESVEAEPELPRRHLTVGSGRELTWGQTPEPLATQSRSCCLQRRVNR